MKSIWIKLVVVLVFFVGASLGSFSLKNFNLYVDKAYAGPGHHDDAGHDDTKTDVAQPYCVVGACDGSEEGHKTLEQFIAESLASVATRLAALEGEKEEAEEEASDDEAPKKEKKAKGKKHKSLEGDSEAGETEDDEEAKDYLDKKLMNDIFADLEEFFEGDYLSAEDADDVEDRINSIALRGVKKYEKDRKAYIKSLFSKAGEVDEYEAILRTLGLSDSEDDESEVNEALFYNSEAQLAHIKESFDDLQKNSKYVSKKISLLKRRNESGDKDEKIAELEKKLTINDKKHEMLTHIRHHFKKNIKKAKKAQKSAQRAAMANGLEGLDPLTLMVLEGGMGGDMDLEALLGFESQTSGPSGPSYDFGIRSTPWGGASFNFGVDNEDAKWGFSGTHMGNDGPDFLRDGARNGFPGGYPGGFSPFMDPASMFRGR